MSKLLEVKNVKKYFPINKGLFGTKGSVKAVDGVSFEVNKGETIGIVGESGCGKSTLARTILRLQEATAGEVIYKGKNLFKLNNKDLRTIRQDIQLIFQDPYSSLNPRFTVEQIIKEPLIIHKWADKEKRKERVMELVETVGLNVNQVNRYPHEFSGGQRQRIGIARALALNPSLVVCDEPVSALDVSIQSQILNLLKSLQEKLDLTFLFIAHDLSVVKHVSDKVIVMYLGKIVEIADGDDLYKNPLHPYTKALLSAIPDANPLKKKKRIILKGDVPSPANPPSGCRFHPRCPYAKKECRENSPNLLKYEDNHRAACHFVEEIKGQ